MRDKSKRNVYHATLQLGKRLESHKGRRFNQWVMSGFPDLDKYGKHMSISVVTFEL